MGTRKVQPDTSILAEAEVALKEGEANTSWLPYHCELVTPMYGGGVKAGEVDRKMPIRASAIRGQLRFWWRIACGPFASSAEMFRRETEIWGGIGQEEPMASRVGIKISSLRGLHTEAAFEYALKEGKYKAMPDVASWAEGYSLFSGQGKLSSDKRSIDEPPKELAKSELSFELCVRFDEKLADSLRSEVETALRWWASFGGVGARMRRGVGSVLVKALQPVSFDEVGQKHGVLKILPVESSATKAWQKSVGRLKSFRQGLSVGRNIPSKNSRSPAGRSFWPEADTLRALSGRADPNHAERLVKPDVFPRATFGLPIVFHFKDKSTGDPEDHIVEPKDISRDDKRDRMASPLILHPYWNGSAWQPAALLLPGWESALSQPLKFKGQNYTPKQWPNNTNQRRELAWQIKPMQSRADDPLTAFMQFFEKGL